MTNDTSAEAVERVRKYAAIELRVPDSGTEWLDDMIRQAKRDEFAGQAMAGLLAESLHDCGPDGVAHDCYEYADAMLKQREGE